MSFLMIVRMITMIVRTQRARKMKDLQQRQNFDLTTRQGFNDS